MYIVHIYTSLINMVIGDATCIIECNSLSILLKAFLDVGRN